MQSAEMEAPPAETQVQSVGTQENAAGRTVFDTGQVWMVDYTSSLAQACTGPLVVESRTANVMWSGYMDLTCTNGTGSVTTRQRAVIIDAGEKVTINFSNPTQNGQPANYSPDNYHLVKEGRTRLRGQNRDSNGRGGPAVLNLAG